MAKSHWEIIERINFSEKTLSRLKCYGYCYVVIVGAFCPGTWLKSSKWLCGTRVWPSLKSSLCSNWPEIHSTFECLGSLLHHNYHHHHLNLNSHLKMHFSKRIYNFKKFKMFELNVRNVFRRRLCEEITISMWLKLANDSLK